MLELILKNIAYAYYPNKLSSITQYEQYQCSNEYKNLCSTLNNLLADQEFQKVRGLLLNELNVKVNPGFSDMTLDQHDRCLTFELQIFENHILRRIKVVVSLIIPYFFVYCLKNEIETEPVYRWTELPHRDSESEVLFASQIASIKSLVSEIINFNYFPEHLLVSKVDNINYVDIEMGCFTLFNAFFLDQIEQ